METPLTIPTRAEVEALAAWSRDIREKALTWMRARDHLSELYKAGDDDPMSDDFKAADLKERYAASNLHTIMNCHELIARLDTIDALIAVNLPAQAAPVAEGKPTSAEINALAASAQKAALEAEARESETLSYIEDAVETLEAMDLHIDNPLYDRLRAFLEEKSSADRFMALLEAMERIRVDCETSPKRYSDADCRQRCAIIAREALAAFPQQEAP